MIVALLLKAKAVDEIHVMRKTVIDGSNTSGFQRTCVVALDGEIDVDGNTVPIQHISLEEDAARKMGEEGSVIKYRIDRLGVPLIEITTAPVICSPQDAKKTALTIGRLLRATGRVKRGLGTIRQDVNISIREGALVEIKGVQEVDVISEIIDYEVQRQISLLKICSELRSRGLREEDIKDLFVDVTAVFKQTRSQIIRGVLKQNEGVWAVKLPKFAGLLKVDLEPGIVFGAEIADFARFWGSVEGIFHTDEMPAHEISGEEVDHLKRVLKTGSLDAIFFVAGKERDAEDALKAVTIRCRGATKHVPEETRAANPDGTSRYMRPRPGAARMYPETDVPLIKITEKRLKELYHHLPKLPEEEIKRLMKQYGLNMKLSRQVFNSERTNLFEVISKETSVSPTIVAVVLTETLKALNRDGVEIEKITDEHIRELFHLINSEKTTKEVIPDVLKWLSENEGSTVLDAIKNLDLMMMSRRELEEKVEIVMKENVKLIKERGVGAFGVLMGYVMREVRGRVNAELVSETIKRKLESIAL